MRYQALVSIALSLRPDPIQIAYTARGELLRRRHGEPPQHPALRSVPKRVLKKLARRAMLEHHPREALLRGPTRRKMLRRCAPTK